MTPRKRRPAYTYEAQVLVGLKGPLRLLGSRRIMRPTDGFAAAFVAVGRARGAEHWLSGKCQKLNAVCKLDAKM